MRTSEPDLNWAGEFACDDDRLNAIFRMCQRTVRVGTQEGLMDCPTREQAPYIGDGHPVARWLAMLSGDARHWRYLVREQFRRPGPNGLLRSAVFTGGDQCLIDYSLLAVAGVRDYWRYSGDVSTIREVIEPCRRILAFFDSQVDERELYNFGWQPKRSGLPREQHYDPSRPRLEAGDQNLFIDHPGLGWHNATEAGIDRRGTNAAINALLVLAREALADLEEAVGENDRAQSRRAQARHLARTVEEVFFDPARQVFADGLVEGQLLAQVSQQTNTWAILAGCCDEPTSRRIMQRMLHSDDPKLARSGPYFWTYMYPVLAAMGMHREALEATRKLWGRMIDGGASTLWETFAGDHLDTWCHPWSAAPAEFLLCQILGLPTTSDELNLRPRYDLLKQAVGTIASPSGPISIRWQRAGAGIALRGRLPEGREGEVFAPGGNLLGRVRGEWELRTSLPAQGE